MLHTVILDTVASYGLWRNCELIEVNAAITDSLRGRYRPRADIVSTSAWECQNLRTPATMCETRTVSGCAVAMRIEMSSYHGAGFTPRTCVKVVWRC